MHRRALTPPASRSVSPAPCAEGSTDCRTLLHPSRDCIRNAAHASRLRGGTNEREIRGVGERAGRERARTDASQALASRMQMPKAGAATNEEETMKRNQQTTPRNQPNERRDERGLERDPNRRTNEPRREGRERDRTEGERQDKQNIGREDRDHLQR